MEWSPDVSVVIPTYNRAVLVERAIASINEPDLAVEIIVVDDGSTDESRVRLGQRRDIVYLRCARNAGQAVARNIGAGAARAPYIAFLDSDDLRLPRTIALQLARLESRRECALVYGRSRYLDDAPASHGVRRLAEGDVYAALFGFNFISTCTAVVRSSVLREVGGFDPKYRRSEEWDLWFRIGSRYPVCAVDADVVLVTPPFDDGHASGDPVKIERASVRVVRDHLQSTYCRAMSPIERRRVYREFVRIRIEMMLWKVLSRGTGGSVRLRLRCALACLSLSPSYMMRKHNIKNLAMLLFSSAWGRGSGATEPGAWTTKIS